MNFLQNGEVFFNQESLPIIYHNFHYKNLIRPKIKSTKISTHKLQSQFFTERLDAPSKFQKRENLPKYLGEN